jgi:ribA/ribD-fused uncharacterized protein
MRRCASQPQFLRLSLEFLRNLLDIVFLQHYLFDVKSELLPSSTEELVTLYRPVGPKELALIRASGFREFPPRLPEQPIFYPVLNEEYARQIAQRWNVSASGAGFVTRFALRREFAARYQTQIVGTSLHQELWIPAEDLAAMNQNLVGLIEVIAEFTSAGGTPPVRFYRVSDPYGEFSNFSPHPFTLWGRVWPTSEHYFQARKFAGSLYEEEIRRAKSSMLAARLGRSRAHPLREDWETVKESVMREALAAKFGQHPALKAVLLGTGEAELIEHTRNDRYWGDGGDGAGKNRLGHLLMELRAKLRAE